MDLDDLATLKALQGEGADQKLLVLLRVGEGRELPDQLWTYNGTKTS